NGKFVAVGDSGKIAYSADGIDWSIVQDSTFGTSMNNINAIAYGNGKFIAGGTSGKMAYSSGL
ncbi:MAG: cell wall-binding protein, partial [Treponema sp.]|nr:cell wall-binding protein [Treponema sp.]